MPERLALAWSGGKDCCWTLDRLRREGREVAALVTTVTREYDRVTIHGVRRSVLRRQAAMLGLPLVEVDLPAGASNAMYEFAWGAAMRDLAAREAVTGVAFGDLFLADVRAWRERQLEPLGLEARFPLWGIRTDLLADRMQRAGVEARVVCLDPARVDPALAGARWDAEFLRALPREVDPCGERGEFHTFVSDGPGFAEPLEIEVGVTVEREGSLYTDVLLVERLPIATPCRNVCRLGGDALCDGCGRTGGEIAGWIDMTPDERRAVMTRVRDWTVRGAGAEGA